MCDEEKEFTKKELDALIIVMVRNERPRHMKDGAAMSLRLFADRIESALTQNLEQKRTLDFAANEARKLADQFASMADDRFIEAHSPEKS